MEHKCAHCAKKKERTEKEYKDLINRLNRIEGQVRGVKNMVENDAYCMDIITQASAIAAALNLSLIHISLFSSGVNDIKGKLTGNSYSCYFYDNSGNKFMTAKGDKIGLTSNVVEEGHVDSDDGTYSKSYGLSSIITLNIDGKQLESCGDTIIFEQTGLQPDAESVSYTHLDVYKRQRYNRWKDLQYWRL